VCGGQIITDG